MSCRTQVCIRRVTRYSQKKLLGNSPIFRNSFTVSQMRARLLKLMLLRSGRNKLDVPILMTCNKRHNICRPNKTTCVENSTDELTTTLLAGSMLLSVVASNSSLMWLCEAGLEARVCVAVHGLLTYICICSQPAFQLVKGHSCQLAFHLARGR